MNNKQNQSGYKKPYLVLLLLVVGLAAFSSAMSELNQLQSLTVETGRLIASWSDMVVPTASQFPCYCELMRSDFCSSERQPLR
jgi:hypothetical protein